MSRFNQLSAALRAASSAFLFNPVGLVSQKPARVVTVLDRRAGTRRTATALGLEPRESPESRARQAAEAAGEEAANAEGAAIYGAVGGETMQPRVPVPRFFSTGPKDFGNRVRVSEA